MEWYEIVISILAGIATAIPLVVKLVQYVQKAVKEKNWQSLLSLVTNLMEEAETKFDNGASRREWVLGMVEASAKTINYDVDLEEVGQLVDSLCAMTRIVNPPKEEEVSE